MQTIIPKLESLPYVEKYCRWSSWWTTSGLVPASRILTDGKGNITALGNQYNSFGSSRRNWITSGHNYNLSAANNLAADKYGATINRVVVKQYTPSSNTNQHSTILNLNNCDCKLVNKISGKKLDNGGTSTAGESMIQWNDNASNTNNLSLRLDSTE